MTHELCFSIINIGIIISTILMISSTLLYQEPEQPDDDVW